MQAFRSTRNPLVRAVAALTSCLLASNSVLAVEPTPTTYADVPVPYLTEWDDVNTFTVDGITGATSKTLIYPDAATKTTAGADTGDWDEGLANALVLWELDDGSGRAPGLQVVTDDFDLPVNNCIMASGERESDEFTGTIVPKTSRDPEGSSKRYFLELIKADEPVDLVFNLGIRDIRYKGVKDPLTDGGAALEEFSETYGIGRIYRVIQKVINNTDERIAHIRFELGTGVGDDFTPVTFAEHGVAFEMRTLVPREFFYGETGAPEVEVWNPDRFATFSPKMYDDGSRPRFDPGFLDNEAAGFFPPQDVEAGEKSQYIDSGLPTVAGDINGSLTDNYFDVANNQGASAGLVGNVFGYMMSDSLAPIVIARHDDGDPATESDAIVAWWDGANWRYGEEGADGIRGNADDFGVVAGAQLVQWAEKILGLPVDCPEGSPVDCSYRYESLIADDLSGLNTDMYLYISDKLMDESGDLTLDSITLRVKAVSVDAAGLTGQPGAAQPEWDKPGNEAPELASYMPATGTPVAINDSVTVEEADPVVDVSIDVLANDLLDGQSLDPADVTAVTITSAPANGTAVVEADNTITYTPAAGVVGTETFSYTATIDGGGTPVVSNEATVKVTVEAAPVPDAPIANNDTAFAFSDLPVTVNVLENDELNNDAPGTVVVSIVDAPLNGTATVAAGNVISYQPSAGFTGYERFTYKVTVDDKVSNVALVTINVEQQPATPRSSTSNGGCSVGNGKAPFDPMLPGLALLALAGLFLRRRRAA